MPTDALQVRESRSSGTWTLEVSGDLDLRTAPDLCSRLTARRGARLVVDLTALEFRDSAGLRALICEARESEIAGGSLVIVAPPGGRLRRLLEVTGLVELLRVRADLPHATAAA